MNEEKNPASEDRVFERHACLHAVRPSHPLLNTCSAPGTYFVTCLNAGSSFHDQC